MNEFFKRNLVWVAILLCIAGVVLSIIGIPAGNPIFFFIGIILSIPTIGYLIYQVFFYREKAELDLAPATAKFSTSNITSIITDKNDVLLQDNITNETNLEPLYNGYANDQEITKRLHEVTDNERDRMVIDLPTIDLPAAKPNHAFDDTTAIQNTTNEELLRQREVAANLPNMLTPEVFADLADENENINPTKANTTEEETAPVSTTYTVDAEEESYPEYFNNNAAFAYENNAPVKYAHTESTESEPVEFAENNEPTESENDEPVETKLEESQPESRFVATNASLPIHTTEDLSEPEQEYVAPSLNDPNFVPENEPLMPQNIIPVETPVATAKNLTQVDLTNAKIVYINPEQKELRKQKAQEKKNLLAQANLERYLQRYYIETAACFLMDRTIYKDKNGIAPYNKFAVNKDTNLPEYTMSATKGRLYKFCTYLIDTERFIKHPDLYDDFITEVERGVPLARISEALHPLYRKKYKKDFVLNLSNREDWDNVMILVYNNYLLSNNNFKNVFTHVPFEIPVAYKDENVVDYLKDPDIQDRFAEKYPALEEMGIPTFWEAIYICFINSIKQKLSITQMETALLREYKKIARALKRADNTRRKQLKKAS